MGGKLLKKYNESSGHIKKTNRIHFCESGLINTFDTKLISALVFILTPGSPSFEKTQ